MNYYKEENIMKKLIMAALTILAVLAFSVTAMAGAINNDSSNVVFGGEATYDMSNKVYVDYTQDANNQKFGIGTVHAGGNRQFATSSETSVIFWKTCAKGTTDALVGNASWTTGQYAGASGWSAL
jgi:type 1 fimbria pilin